MQVSWRRGLRSADFRRSNFSRMRIHLFVGHDGSGLPLTILAPNSARLLAARQRPPLIKTSGYPERQESESLRSDRDCGCQPRPSLCHGAALAARDGGPAPHSQWMARRPGQILRWKGRRWARVRCTTRSTSTGRTTVVGQSALLPRVLLAPSASLANVAGRAVKTVREQA